MTNSLPKRMLGKSKFSMYLRTKCDRELYLSLFPKKPDLLQAGGIPIPLKSRTDVQLITQSGREFEYEQYDDLINAIPNYVIHKSNGRAEIDLKEALEAAEPPCFILQPQIEPEGFRDIIFDNLEITQEARSYIPELSGLRPDVLFVGKAGSAAFEILPCGSRKPVTPDDNRLPISVIDLKNITEANASYSAEVCLYAFFLANWIGIQDQDISSKFFIADTVYLWRHVEMPQFTKIRTQKEGGDHTKRVTALLNDLKDGQVNYLVYMPSVRKFFAQDVPRVVKAGDEKGWSTLDYHVNPRCASCDWLGNESWLSPEGKAILEANPSHYCFKNAEIADHLSKMPTLSRGAAKVLHGDGYKQLATLADLPPSTPSLKKHALLKKDRIQLGSRASALLNDTVSVDTKSKVGGLAKYWSAEYSIIVNFDSGVGLLTGIALRGIISSPYGQSLAEPGQPFKSLDLLGEEAFVVPKDNLAAEWAVLQAFVDQLAAWVERADAIYAQHGWGKVHTQICFWEPRQYEELCNAFGRHLIKILALPAKAQRALAWIFPADTLMEREEEICPSIVWIRDVFECFVLSSQRFAVTLLGTVEQYHHPKLLPRSIDKYYIEPLGNAIPRERIFDIWKSPTGTVRIFGKDVTISEAIGRYGKVLSAHAYALGSITARLRSDLKEGLSAKAPALKTTIPQGITGVGYDSKIWSQWATVSAATVETEARLALVTRPEWLEASYKAIILNKIKTDHGAHQHTFVVSDESTEAKIEEGDAYCAVGVVGMPGFLLQTPAKLGIGDETTDGYYAQLHTIIAAKVVTFDRANREVVVKFRARYEKVEPIFDALMAANVLGIGKQSLYLMDGMPYDDSRITTGLLKKIGNPAIATPAPEALASMGKGAAKKIAKGKDHETPASRVLWAADKLAKGVVRTTTEIEAIVKYSESSSKNPLNPSQIDAIRNVAKNALSIVWGPPGTGKTKTLAAFLHAAVFEKKHRNILITGPNYRTVDELSERLVASLSDDPNAQCSVYWLCSRSRDPKTIETGPDHLFLKSMKINDPDVQKLKSEIDDPDRTVVIATTAHLVNQVNECVSDTCLDMDTIFDLIVLDESSQVPVTLALRPICGLKENSQLVIAGDHLQMPPIQALEPPAGAEYLVSSIQSYLIKRFSIPRRELLINYRSNSHLVEYAKTLGYPHKLSSFSPEKQLFETGSVEDAISALPSELPQTDAYSELLDPQKKVIALIHDDPISSQANEVEAGLVAAIAFCLRHSMAKELNEGQRDTGTPLDDDFFFDETLGIVTPHKAQKALVVRALINMFPDADVQKVYDSVDTVERFQGGERQTIIVSFGVGDTDVIEGEEAFLLQMERTNVAVSRAMAKCIVLMPESLAYHLPGDREAAEASKAIKSYIEEFCRNRRKSEIAFNDTKRSAEVRWH